MKVLWICGRPGSGKTTLLRALQKLRPELACFDADEVRASCVDLGYTDQARWTNIILLARLARTAAEAGRCAVVAAVTPTNNLRTLARERCGVDFHLIHMTGRARELWEGSTYAEPDNAHEIVNDSDDHLAAVASSVVGHYLSQPSRQLFIGRWQPFHDGHKTIILEALANGPVAVGVRQTCISESDPYDAHARVRMVREWAAEHGHDVEPFIMPDINSIHIGRDVGYDVVQHGEVPGVSGTALRKKM